MEKTELIRNALRYVHASYGKPELTIDDIAKNAGFSTDYFNRIFRAHTGFNVMEYVRFRRLTNAARQLRQSEDDILEIALSAGYESHDGFTRAFKAQYGKTPSEYRSAMRDTPFTFADLGLNAAAAGQCLATLPDFHVMDPDEAIDYLLMLDARRFGYEAITIKWNGSCVLADADPESTGCLVAADLFFQDGPYLNCKLRDISNLHGYIKKLLPIEPWVCGVCFETDPGPDAVRAAMEGLGYQSLEVFPQAMYLGDTQILPKTSRKYTFRFLEPDDRGALDVWIPQALGKGDWGLYHSITAPRASHPDDQPIGMFLGNTLIGVARIAPQEAHGFRLNNCVSSILLPAYRGKPEERWLYQAVTNIVLEMGYIPFEDALLGEESAKSSGFTATDLGYTLVNTVYLFTFR